MLLPDYVFFFFFNDTATTEIYTLSLHDALPISFGMPHDQEWELAEEICKRYPVEMVRFGSSGTEVTIDRKSTRLNSSHGYISYAVFCLKKKNTDYVSDARYYMTSCRYQHRDAV